MPDAGEAAADGPSGGVAGDGPERGPGHGPAAAAAHGALTYAGAGVDIAAGEEAVQRIKDKVRSTFRPEVVGDIGGFGGLFAMPHGYRHPVLVSTTDGVGTKALVARAAGRFTTIGVDLVAMCVDDLVCQGAEPLFFNDYIAVGRLDPDHIDQLVEGIAEGCRQAGCALTAGEMAEHPGAMEPGAFDLVGFAVGVVERDRVVTGHQIRSGDVLIGLHSPGLRCNGYSLVRKVMLEVGQRPLDGPAWAGARRTLADELLEPSVIYAPAVAALLRAVEVKGVAHITGGGLPGNIARVLPPSCDAVLRTRSWEVPRIFTEIQRLGEVDDEEMARVFNLGIGMVVVVPPGDAFRALDLLRAHGRGANEIGVIEPGRGTVRMVGGSAG